MDAEKYLLIASMNPSIDVTMHINAFVPGGTNRAHTVQEDAGGKGINVARALKGLGAAGVICTGFLWQEGSGLFYDALEKSGVKADFLTLPGSVRRNIKVFDAQKGEITEINAASPLVSAQELLSAKERIVNLAKKARFVVLTGSLPKGADADFYEGVISAVDSPCALDADGEALLCGVRAKPAVLKCNEKELSVLHDSGTALEKAKAVVDSGVSTVIASMGADGAILADARGAWRALPVKLNVRSTVGAGDAMLSGYLAAVARGETGGEALKYASACASACVEGEGTCVPDMQSVCAYMDRIKIERMMEW